MKKKVPLQEILKIPENYLNKFYFVCPFYETCNNANEF